MTGQWDDAIAELEASIELAEETGETYSQVCAHGVLSLVSLHRNDLTRARETAGAAAKDLANWGSFSHSMAWAAWPRALIMEADGESGEALATLADTWDRCLSSGIVQYGWRMVGGAGETGRARDTSAAVAQVACGSEVSWIAGAALRCRGLVEDDAEILQAAADAYADGSRPLYLALACEDAGDAFARQGRPDRGRPLLDRAIGIYERMGAARDHARAAAVLRSTGQRLGQGARSRPQFGWPSHAHRAHRR